MAVSEFNEDTQDQICDLLENLQQIEKLKNKDIRILLDKIVSCLLYTSPSPRDRTRSRMPSSA